MLLPLSLLITVLIFWPYWNKMHRFSRRYISLKLEKKTWIQKYFNYWKNLLESRVAFRNLITMLSSQEFILNFYSVSGLSVYRKVYPLILIVIWFIIVIIPVNRKTPPSLYFHIKSRMCTQYCYKHYNLWERCARKSLAHLYFIENCSRRVGIHWYSWMQKQCKALLSVQKDNRPDKAWFTILHPLRVI